MGGEKWVVISRGKTDSVRPQENGFWEGELDHTGRCSGITPGGDHMDGEDQTQVFWVQDKHDPHCSITLVLGMWILHTYSILYSYLR